MRSVTGGSVNSDYNGDVVALGPPTARSSTTAWSGPGTLNDAVVALTGQTDLDRLLGVGDYNGDGTNDLLATDRQGKTWLYLGEWQWIQQCPATCPPSVVGTAVLG